MHIPRVTSKVVRVLVGLSVVCALLPAGNVLADDGQPDGDPQPRQLDGSEPLPPKPKYPKLGSDLSRLAEEIDRAVEALEGEPPPEQYLRVPVTIRGTYNVSSTVALLESGGARVANIGHEYIEAIVPVTLLVRLASHEGVTRVETIVPPEPDVTSQGAQVHRSPIWNARGYTGAGVRVGVIDLGFIGFSGLMGTELPSSVVARCYTAIGVFTSSLADCETDSVHGTAVAEAVVDMAPDVSLYIANIISAGDLQASASWMVSQGVSVINMSLGWTWDGPGDGTSSQSDSPLNTVDLAANGGVIWANSAGNSANNNWYGSYSDLNGDGELEFTAGVELNRVDLSAGERIIAQLRWDDTWGKAARDFELLLYDGSLTLVALSDDEQSGGAGQDPYEVFSYVAPSAGAYYLAIDHFAGGVPSWLQMSTFNQVLSIAVASYSIGNPAESANTGMLAVGAADWRTPDTIESFSSRGPTIDGRTKPDIVGADGGDSVSYPSGFFGTSQASPHVAGLAALVAQQFPDFTPAQVADYLKSNALPLGTVPNDTWGYGLAELPSLTPGPPTNVAAATGDGKATVTWSAPAADGGSTITQYIVTSNPAAATTTVDGSTLSATVTGLSNRTSYTFTVVAVNSVGSSSPSAASNAVTPVSLTPVPVPAAQAWALLALAAVFAAILVVSGRRQPRRTLR